jgi:hypothetical protein
MGMNDFLMDIQNSFDVKSAHVVKYDSSWIEHGHLFIQMQLCSHEDLNKFFIAKQSFQDLMYSIKMNEYRDKNK